MHPQRLLILVWLMTWSVMANAQQSQPLTPDSVLAIMQASMAPAANKLTAQAITWLGSFSALQFLITNYGSLKNGSDTQQVIAKAAASIAWVAICIYFIQNGPSFIGAVGKQMFGVLDLQLPSPGSIIKSTISIVAGLAALAVGVGGVGVIGSTTGGILLVYVLLFILATGMFFAFKIFMLQLELGLIIMMAPMSFSLLGLNATRDQGISPFKALLSLIYRIILLSVILSAFTQVSNVATEALSSLSLDSITDGIGLAFDVVISALAAYLLLAYLVYKSDSVAATLASGSTNMGTGDVASAAAAGAAVGAAIVSGGAGGASVLSQLPKSMSEFMKGLGSPGSVSNALGSGMGGGDEPPTPPADPSMSLAATQGPTPANFGRFDGTTQGMSRADAMKLAVQAPFGSFDQSESFSPSSTASTASSTIGAIDTSNAMAQGSRSAPGSSYTAPSAPTSRGEMPLGSGLNEGISDPRSMAQDFNKTQAGQQQRRKPTFRERLSDANREISREQAGTTVSINANNVD